MRVLQVLHGWPPRSAGGTGLYVGALARALGQQGHAVAVLAPGDEPGLVEHPGPDGALVFRLGQPPPAFWEETWSRPEVDGLFREALRRWRPDVVHIHHLSGLSFGVLVAARASAARVVVTLHDYATVCARGQLVDRDALICSGPSGPACARCLAPQFRLDPLTGAFGRLLLRWPRLRARARTALGGAPQDERRAARRLLTARNALAHAHVVLAPSRDLADRVAALAAIPVQPCELPLVNAIAPAPPPGKGPLRLLFAGAVIPTKGPQRVVEAFANLPSGAARLTVAGPAPPYDGWPGFADILRARVESLPGARWLGEVPPEGMSDLLAEHDVLVLPSTWPENSPLVIREATAAGLRVILGSLGGAGELAPAAVRVDPYDEAALFRALADEVRRGRGRLPPATWTDPDTHAAALAAIYAGRQDQARSRHDGRPIAG